MTYPDDELSRAFQAVFGTNDQHRNREQLVVLAKLRELCKPGRSLWEAGQDPTALAFAQGRLRVWQEIDLRISPKPMSAHELLGNPAVMTEEDRNE